MNDPKKPTEPRRTSQPNPMPGETPPMEAPGTPNTEFEHDVPHSPNQPVASKGAKGEGSYEGTAQYQEGIKRFEQQQTPEQSLEKAKTIDPNDPSLKSAEKRGKNGAIGAERVSTPSIH